MLYETENCYPDMGDLRRALQKVRPTADQKVLASEIYQDYRAAFEWLNIAIRGCHWSGSHSFQPLADVKSIAEEFVGRPLNEDAFLAATLTGSRKLKPVNKDFGETKIKVPPFDSAKIQMTWEQHLGRLKEVVTETANNPR